MRPLAFTKNPNHGFYLVLGAWILAAICAIPVTISTHVQLVDGLKQCYVNYTKTGWKIYMVYLTGSLLVVPAIIIAICYTHIVYTIWRRPRSVMQQQQQQQGQRGQRGQRGQNGMKQSPANNISMAGNCEDEDDDDGITELDVIAAAAVAATAAASESDDSETAAIELTKTAAKDQPNNSPSATGGFALCDRRRPRSYPSRCQEELSRAQVSYCSSCNETKVGGGGILDQCELEQDETESRQEDPRDIGNGGNGSSSGSSGGGSRTRKDPPECITAGTTTRIDIGQLLLLQSQITTEPPNQRENDDDDEEEELEGACNLGADASDSSELIGLSSSQRHQHGCRPATSVRRACNPREEQEQDQKRHKYSEQPLPPVAATAAAACKGHRILESPPPQPNTLTTTTASKTNTKQDTNLSRAAAAAAAAKEQKKPVRGNELDRKSHGPMGGAQQHGIGVIPKARIKTIKMTLVIVFAFILCWLPFCIINLCSVFELIRNDTHFAMAILTFSQSLAHLNSAVNPIIFWLFSSKRRTSTKDSNKSGGGGNHNNKSGGDYTTSAVRPPATSDLH